MTLRARLLALPRGLLERARERARPRLNVLDLLVVLRRVLSPAIRASLTLTDEQPPRLLVCFYEGPDTTATRAFRFTLDPPDFARSTEDVALDLLALLNARRLEADSSHPPAAAEEEAPGSGDDAPDIEVTAAGGGAGGPEEPRA